MSTNPIQQCHPINQETHPPVVCIVGDFPRNSLTLTQTIEFSWEEIKKDKYKDFYLGHSVRLQQAWWEKKQLQTKAEHEKKVREEISSVQQKEEELMEEMLYDVGQLGH